FFDAAPANAPGPSPAPSPSPGTAVAFLAADTTTRGGWKGTYGTQGYSLASDGVSLPSYAVLQQPGATWVWANTTADTRALIKAPASDRIAAAWYGSTVTTDVNLTDGVAHRVAIYVIDWDSNGRTETVDVLDAAGGAVLDTRSVASFSGGQYLAWSIK